jgi:uncharacterized protein
MKTEGKNIYDYNDLSEILTEGIFSTMVKPVGQRCNLNCTYCYYRKPERKESGLMSETLLEEYIRQYITGQDSDIISFCWHGGEPTTAGLAYFKKAVELQKKYSDGKQIDNTLQTNGILIDHEWCRFFIENNFLVGLSIDGPASVHDGNRIWNGHRSSFDAAVRAAEMFHDTGVEFNTLTTVNKLNEDRGEEVYIFLRDVIGSTFMQFLPVADQAENPSKASIHSTSPEGYGKFLTDIFDIWVRNDVGNVFVQIFESTLAQLCGLQAGVCTLGEYCSNALTVEHNGDVYPCDHYVSEEYWLGNIAEQNLTEIFKGRKRTDFTLAKKTGLSETCIRCRYNFLCHGECPKHRFGGKSESYLCKGLKHYFEHVEPYMAYMKGLLEAGLPASLIRTRQL